MRMKKVLQCKTGEVQPRVLVSSEKPRKTPRRIQDRRAADTISTEQVAGGSMKILRLSVLSLTLAVAVISFGWLTPAFSAKPDCTLEPPPPIIRNATKVMAMMAAQTLRIL